jgi:hypothetical protein
MRAQIITQLGASESDISVPHEFSFYFYFPTHLVAERASDAARAAGYTVVVRPAAKGTDWLCLVSRYLIPSTAPWAEIETFAHELASTYDGEFDGWESEVVKR